MAYKRKTFKRKTNYKKKGTGVAKKALRKVNALAKKLKPEVKFVDFKVSPEDMGTLGIVYNITKTIQQNITNSGRIGRKVRLLRLTGMMQIELDTIITSGAFRFMLVKGNAEDAKTIVISRTAAASNDIPILDDTDSWPLVSRRVDDDSKRLRVIYDKVYTLDNGRKRMITQKINFKLGWEVQMMSNVDVTNIQDGGLYICGMNNSAEELTTMYNFRLWYTDVQ